MDLLRDTLLAASQPYARGGGQSSTAAPSKGVGGSWAMLSEASTLPGFESELRRLVAELYPRAPHQRSGLDQVLQRLLADQPRLAGAVVSPVLAALQRQADSMAAGSGNVEGPGCGGGGGGAGVGAGDAAAVDVSAGGKKRKKGKKGKAGAAPQDAAADSGAAQGVAVTAAMAEAVEAEASEELGLAGVHPAPADVDMATAADAAAAAAEDDMTQHGDGGDAAAGPHKPPHLPPPSSNGAALHKYDTRALPVAWLLQCFGPVPPSLRCLWPGQRQLRAAILEAAAASFAESQGKGTSSQPPTLTVAAHLHATPQQHVPPPPPQQQQPRRRRQQQGGCPVAVRFARDCLAATPAHLRLQLLEDAVGLSRQRRPQHDAGGAAQVLMQASQVQTGPCGKQAAGEGDNDGAGGGATPRPQKRRRLDVAPALGRTGNGRPAVVAGAAETGAEAEEAASHQPQHGPQPCSRCGWVSSHTAATGGGGEPQAAMAAAEAAALPRRLPWAALLAAVCEEEAAEAEARAAQGGAPPRGGSVLSPLALTELLLARGDLFCPECDVAAAAPTVLRCLTSLAPDQTAGLLQRVLAASRPFCSGDWSSTTTSTSSSGSSSSSRSRSGGSAELQLVAALEVLRRPLRGRVGAADASTGDAGADVGAVGDPGGGASGSRKRGARLPQATAAAAAAAVQSPTAECAGGSSQAPEPLSALWLLAHVLPPLLEPLSRCRDSAPWAVPLAAAAAVPTGAEAAALEAEAVPLDARGNNDAVPVATAAGGGAAQVAVGEGAEGDDEANREGDGTDAAAGAVWDGQDAHDAQCLGALRALLARPALLLPDGTYEGGGGCSSSEQHGGGGGQGVASGSVGGGALALAVETAAAQLPVASQVFALHLRSNARSAAAQRLMAALLLDAFGAAGSLGGGSSSSSSSALESFGTTQLDPGPGLRLAEALCLSCSTVTSGATSLTAGPQQQRQQVRDLVAAAWADRTEQDPPLWPGLRPLLPLLEPLSSCAAPGASAAPTGQPQAQAQPPQLCCDHPVAAAVRAMLLMALGGAAGAPEQVAPGVDVLAASTRAADVAAVADALMHLLVGGVGSGSSSGSSSSGSGGGGSSGAAVARGVATALGGMHAALATALLPSWRVRLDVARVLVLAAGLEQPIETMQAGEAAAEPTGAAAAAPHCRTVAHVLMERVAVAVPAVAAALPPEALPAAGSDSAAAAAGSARGAKGRLTAAASAATAAALSKLQSEVELVRLCAAVLQAMSGPGEAQLCAAGARQPTAGAPSRAEPEGGSGDMAGVPLLARAAAGSLTQLLRQQCRQPASPLAAALRRFAFMVHAVGTSAKEGPQPGTRTGYGGTSVAVQQGQVQAVVEALGTLAAVVVSDLGTP